MQTLLADAEAWRRAYIAAVEEGIAGSGQSADASPELAEWLSWARDQADRLDPAPTRWPDCLAIRNRVWRTPYRTRS